MNWSKVIPLIGSIVAFLAIIITLLFAIKNHIIMKRKYKEKYKRK